MPTTKPSTGLALDAAPGAAVPDTQIQAFFRRYLPDFYFVNTPLSRMRRHLELLRQLPAKPLQFDFFRPPQARFTELTICAHDDAAPGLLAKVAGTLVASRVNVSTAWIHTLSDPHADPNSTSNESESNRHVVLDTLLLSESTFGRTRALSSRVQNAISNALGDVLSGQADVETLISRKAPRLGGPLDVRDLSVTSAGNWTLVKLCAADHPGILYRAARSLSRLQLDVAHAQINTFDKSVDDVFFVTDRNGLPLEDAQLPRILEQLCAELESAS